MSDLEQILERLRPLEEKLLSENYSDEEYRELLFAMGLSDREIGILQEHIQDFINRGENYLSHGLPKEALVEWRNAEIIAPNRLEIQLGLAKSYLQIWKQDPQKSWEELTEKHAKRCLEISSESKIAVAIIAELKLGNAKATQQKSKKNAVVGKQKHRLSGIIFIAIAVGLGLIYSVGKGGGKSAPKIETPPVVEEKVVTPKTPIVKSTEPIMPDPVEIPTQNNLSPAAKAAGLSIDVRQSHYRSFEKSAAYQLNGFVSIPKGILTELILTCEGFDAKGNKLFEKAIYPRIPYQGQGQAQQPGDKIPFLGANYEQTKGVEVNHVKLSVKAIQLKTAEKQYPSAKLPKIIKSYEDAGTNAELKILERFSNVNYNAVSKHDMLNLVFEIENIGQTDILEAECGLNLLDANGKLLGKEKLVLWSEFTSPPLKKGDKAVYFYVVQLKNLKSPVKDYELEIKSFKF